MSKRNEKTESGLTKVRVLSDCAFGLCGEVAEVPTELVAQYEARAFVDSHPDAVAYAKLLQSVAEPAAEG